MGPLQYEIRFGRDGKPYLREYFNFKPVGIVSCTVSFPEPGIRKFDWHVSLNEKAVSSAYVFEPRVLEEIAEVIKGLPQTEKIGDDE